MKKVFLFGLTIALFASCKQMGYKTAKSGLEYKIISNGKDTAKLKQGDMLMVAVCTKTDYDSVLNNSYESGHELFVYDTAMFGQSPKYSLGEIFPMLKIGDSAIIKLRTDSINKQQYGADYKKADSAAPRFLKNGRIIYQSLRIIKKFTDSAEFAKEKEMQSSIRQSFMVKMQAKQEADAKKKQAEEDKANQPKFDQAAKELDAYIEKNLGAKKASLIKTKSGAYVEIESAGTGIPADSGMAIKVKYKGTLLDGTIFDQNMDKAETLDVPVLGGGMVPGFDEGLAELKKGDKAKLYIPAKAGYSSSGRGDKIKPFANLIFNIEVVDVLPMAQFTKEQQAKQEAMMKQYQKQQAEAAKNAKPEVKDVAPPPPPPPANAPKN
jgi:FKBP-type peptidyl-prolyl cis-trans isomerase FkpA